MYSMLPWDSPYDKDGNLVPHRYSGWVNTQQTNYLYDLQWNYSESKYYEFMGSLDFDIKITDWLTFSSVNNYKYNLLDNAIKFCPGGGSLALVLEQDGQKARLRVRNTGQTIPAEELPLLFDRFHKADKARSADREGWGLGLYIAKTIVGAHGGEIWATSENGVTEFCFTLPVVR